MNRCECTCWTRILSSSQPIILFTAAVLPLSCLTTLFPLFPSSCRVISWWVRSGCSVALKFGTHHGSCDNALPVWCHSSPVRWRYESIRRIANRHFLMVLWRSLGFKVWAKKNPRNIHHVSEFTIRNVLYVLYHWEERGKWVCIRWMRTYCDNE